MLMIAPRSHVTRTLAFAVGWDVAPSRALASEPVFQFGSCVVPRGVALVGSGKVFKQPADVREFVRQFQGAHAVLGGKLALLISAAPAPHNASAVVHAHEEAS